jgi:uncharacterized protein
MFTQEIIQHLGYYVYRLIDPRNGETFYVGKGVANRVFQHAKGEVEANDVELSDKLQRIRDIRMSGFDVAHVIHRHGLDERTAYEVEAALIDAYAGITNIVSGHDADERGVMHAQQIIERYKAEEIDFQHRIIMITVNHTVLEKQSVYDAVRYAWRLDPQKARQAELVLAVRQGIVIGVFVPHEWLAATPENFEGRPDQHGRWGFRGEEAPESVRSLYMRRRVPDAMTKRGAANPLRYIL